MDKGYDPTMGARPLRRAIQRFIEDPLADFVLGRSIEPGSTILVNRHRRRGRGRHHPHPRRTAGRAQKVTVPAEEPKAEDGDDTEDSETEVRAAEVLAPELCGRRAAEQCQCDRELVAEQLQHVLHALVSPGGEAPDHRPADKDRLGPEREGDRDPGFRRLIPPSISTSTRSPTASTTSGSVSSEATHRSSCRPPWLETTTPAQPWSALSTASSAVRTPLASTGIFATSWSHSRSRQVRRGSISSAARDGVSAPRSPSAEPETVDPVLRLQHEAGAQVALSPGRGSTARRA